MSDNIEMPEDDEASITMDDLVLADDLCIAQDPDTGNVVVAMSTSVPMAPGSYLAFGLTRDTLDQAIEQLVTIRTEIQQKETE